MIKLQRMLYGGDPDYNDLLPEITKYAAYACGATCYEKTRDNPLNYLNCIDNCVDSVGAMYNKAKQRENEGYRPYNPFYSDRLSSKPNRVMWIIILIFIIGLIVFMSQQK